MDRVKKITASIFQLRQHKPVLFYTLTVLFALVVISLGIVLLKELSYARKVSKAIALLKEEKFKSAEALIESLPERKDKYILSIYIYTKTNKPEKISQSMKMLSSRFKIDPYALKRYLEVFSGNDFDSVMFRGLLMDSVNTEKLSRREKIEIFETVKERTRLGYRVEERVYATDLIGRLQIPQSVPLLEKLIKDPSTPWGVKFIAEDHLKRLRKKTL